MTIERPPLHLISAVELAGLPPETAEEAYRRGYQDGYVSALNDLGDLRERRVAWHDAWNRCWAHWNGALDEWRRKRTPAFELPPNIRPSGKRPDGAA